MSLSTNRRTFLATSASLLAIGPMRMAWAQGSGTPVTIGVITPSTGTFAYAGELIAQGAALAVEAKGNRILGRPIRIITRDDEGKPAVGVRRVQEAAASDGMTYFLGAYSSAVGLAESEIAQREKLVQYAAGGSEDFTGARCGRYTFQWSAHPYTAVRTTLEYVRKMFPEKKKIYSLTADYVFGHALLKYTQVVAQELGFELVGNDNHPLGERQFTSLITKAVAARPDILFLNTAGADAVTAIRQFSNYGAKNISVVGPWTLEVDQLPELTPEMRANLVLGQNYYPTIDTPANKEFVGLYQAKHKSAPGYAAAYAYDAVRSLLLAMEQAKTADVQAVVQALETMRWEGVLGQMVVDPNTHQTVRPYFVVRCKAAAEMANPQDFAEIVATGSNTLPASLSACKGMPPL